MRYLLLAIITATALMWAFLAHQREVLAAQKVCDGINSIVANHGGVIEPSLTVDDCIVANRDCAERWGKHYVWAGVSDANNVPICEQSD